jgi:hypothetical protein
MSYIALKSPGRNFEAKDSAITDCTAEIEAERRLSEIRGSKATARNNSSGGSNPDGTSSQGDKDTAGLDSDALKLTSARLVKENVELQMETATSPESELSYSIPNHSDQTKGSHDKPTFELRSGPSDVTSYHDFYSLQIAFENIWTELLDDRINSLGRQLYEEYVKLKDFSGVDDGTDPTISTVDDLKQLMAEIKSYTEQTVQNISPAVHSAAPVTNSTNSSGGSFGNAAMGAGVGVTVGPLIGVEPVTATIIGAVGGWLGWW